jgi:hypothetical protein
MIFEEFLALLEGVKRSGASATARCPAHEDRHASLNVGQGGDGRILLKCFAGCANEEIVAAVGRELAGLFPSRGEGEALPPEIACASAPPPWMLARALRKGEAPTPRVPGNAWRLGDHLYAEPGGADALLRQRRYRVVRPLPRLVERRRAGESEVGLQAAPLRPRQARPGSRRRLRHPRRGRERRADGVAARIPRAGSSWSRILERGSRR